MSHITRPKVDIPHPLPAFRWCFMGPTTSVGDGVDPNAEDKLDTILATIGSTRDALESKVDSLVVGLSLFRADHCKMSDQILKVETTVSEVEPVMKRNSTSITALSNHVKALETRNEDQEGFLMTEDGFPRRCFQEDRKKKRNEKIGTQISGFPAAAIVSSSLLLVGFLMTEDGFPRRCFQEDRKNKRNEKIGEMKQAKLFLNQTVSPPLAHPKVAE
ncbi:hypothetical protein NDU88_005852 [Pleurodeles waltl]|uniref:Uncharacterized protein n=1 Tax=Pleurodeles waltl TaxID=8319 RepID=A0AAV7SMT5_PLEWA|nr:hypothetical protein NDU88_005852 [Pleurodeles waltl]